MSLRADDINIRFFNMCHQIMIKYTCDCSQEIGVCAVSGGKGFGSQYKVQASQEADGKVFDQLL